MLVVMLVAGSHAALQSCLSTVLVSQGGCQLWMQQRDAIIIMPEREYS